jgi:MoaA/NifB/PqqE/SkfB family radical SAM enzyme
LLGRRYRNWARHVARDRRRIFGLRYTTTWRCNSRCTTCSIWRDEEAGVNDLNLEEIDEFSRSRYLRDAEYISLSGGEPTLREDLPAIFSILHRNIPSARFQLTTHGMSPGRVESIFRTVRADNPELVISLVGLSLNGPPEVHDATRGIKGSFDRVVETYDRVKDIVPCMFSFTFCKDNASWFDWVQDFAAERGSAAYICWTVMNERFRVQDKDLVFWKPGMDDVLRRYAARRPLNVDGPLRVLRNLYNLPQGLALSYMYDSIINQRVMPCFAGRQIVHVAPNGDVYPCNFNLSDPRRLGNIRERCFDEVWESIDPSILNEIARGECMYPNGLCGDSDIFPSVWNHPPALIRWYLGKVLSGEPLVLRTGDPLSSAPAEDKPGSEP